MSKMYSQHLIALRSGVKAEDFERFVKEEWPSFVDYPGSKSHVLKGERGDREGKYQVLIEFESLEARNRIFPRSGEPSEEAKRFDQAHPENAKFFEKLGALVAGVGVIFTDYIEIE